MEGLVVANRWKCDKKLGEGAFGAVFRARDLKHKGEVAIKFEPGGGRDPANKFEYDMYQHLRGGEGMPQAYYYGEAAHGKYNCLVLDLLGKSLEDLMIMVGGKLSLKSTLMVADQMIARLEHMHNRGFLHRDIKSENFMMGHSNPDLVYVIDFGLSKSYLKNGRHVQARGGNGLIGTARFVSINTHLGVEQSRRDDMESLGFLIMYLIRGSLPWQGLPGSTREKKYDAIRDKKMATPISELCAGYPPEFAAYLKHVRSLEYDEKPDYRYLRRLFLDCMDKKGYRYDYNYDWTSMLNMGRSNTSKSTKNTKRSGKSGGRGRRQRSRSRERNHHRGRGRHKGSGGRRR